VTRQSLDELAANSFELAGVSVELGGACAASRKHLAHENEPACVEQEIVDVMVEDGYAVDIADGHAASSITATPASTGISAVTVS
jgi:hypothetical protein